MHLHELLDHGVTLLTASRRLAHHVRLSHAQHAQRQGLTAWRSPQVLPWSAWLRQQFVTARAARAAHELRVLTAAQARVLWEEVIASSVSGQTLLNPTSAARLAQTSWRRLHDYLIPLERLSAFDAPEAAALLDWSDRFAQRCASLRLIDEAQLAHWIYEAELVPEQPIALAGFDVYPPAMQRLLERWRAQELVVEHDEHATTAAIFVLGAHDAHTEIEQAAHWAHARLAAGCERIGVVISDLSSRRAEVQRAFEDAFAPGARRSGASTPAIPVALAAPAPLAQYAIVDAALLILELAAGGGSSTDAGRVLRSPFVAGGVSERDQRAVADARLRHEQRDRWDWFELERWAAITGCERLQFAAREVAQLLRTAQPASPAGVWSERMHRLLSAAGWPGERTLNSVEQQTLQKFQATLAEFGALDALAGRMDLSTALHRLRALLRDTPFEPETAPAAITIIDASTSAGMQFDALWAAGLHAERVPPAASPDPLIPFELQRAAGVPEATPAGMLELSERRLTRWCSSAREVVLSWPRHDGDAELSASPLVTRLGAREAQITAASARSLRNVLFERRPALETLIDEQAPPLAHSAARGGARTLELQSTCPFRAQAELRLDAQPLPRVTLGVEPIARGALLHRVLEDVWGGLRTHAALTVVDNEALRERVTDAARRRAIQLLRPIARHHNRLAALEIEYVVRQVMRLLEVERNRPPFTVRFAESSERYALGGLELTIRPDRIDELATGGELLIDYKLGDSHRTRDWLDELPGRPRKPQLPLYALAHGDRLAALAYAVLAPGAVEYRGWSRSDAEGAGVPPYPHGVRIDLGDPADWDALIHQWRFTLTRLAEQYVAGDARVAPLPNQCQTCDLSTLCRIHEQSLHTSGARDE